MTKVFDLNGNVKGEVFWEEDDDKEDNSGKESNSETSNDTEDGL